MGTDIHPAVEVRRNGVWRYHRPTGACKWYDEVWDDQQKVDEQNRRRSEYMAEKGVDRLGSGWPEVKLGDRRNPWDRCKYRLPEAFFDRDYTKFAVLGDVRNDYGWGGQKVVPISSNRGVPDDISSEARSKLSNEHSPGWVTLRELLDYDLKQPIFLTGVISEREFLDCLINRRDPTGWSGSVSGTGIETLTPAQYLELFGKTTMFGDTLPNTRTYDHTKRYQIQYQWMRPVASMLSGLIEMIEYLKPLVPRHGTADDVRVVFDFDS